MFCKKVNFIHCLIHENFHIMFKGNKQSKVELFVFGALVISALWGIFWRYRFYVSGALVLALGPRFVTHTLSLLDECKMPFSLSRHRKKIWKYTTEALLYFAVKKYWGRLEDFKNLFNFLQHMKRPLPKLNARNHCLSYPVLDKLAKLKREYPGTHIKGMLNVQSRDWGCSGGFARF